MDAPGGRGPRDAPRPPIRCPSSPTGRSPVPPWSCSAPRGRRRSSGTCLALLGARVVKVEHPRRPDPFPLGATARARAGTSSVDLGLRARPRPVRSRCWRTPTCSSTVTRRVSSPTPDSTHALARRACRGSRWFTSPRSSTATVRGTARRRRRTVAGRPATIRPAWPRSSVADPVAGLARRDRRRRPPHRARARVRRRGCRWRARSGISSSGSGAVSDERLHVTGRRRDHRDRVRPPADQRLRRRDARRALRGAHRDHRRSRRAGRRVHRRRASTSRPVPTSRSSAPRRRCSRCATPGGVATCGDCSAPCRCR